MLRQHFVLAVETQIRLQRIEREHAARERLANSGLRYRKKVLLYGVPGSGKTSAAERLAWNTGLPLIKADTEVSNLRACLDSYNPCLLFINCDSIAKEHSNEQHRLAFLKFLEEYAPSAGLLIAATNFVNYLDPSLCRQFDDIIEIPKPGGRELKIIVKHILSAFELVIDWPKIVQKMNGFSAAQAVFVAQDAAKRAILEDDELAINKHLEEAIAEAWSKHKLTVRPVSSYL